MLLRGYYSTYFWGPGSSYVFKLLETGDAFGLASDLEPAVLPPN